jgi:hypothetical protein
VTALLLLLALLGFLGLGTGDGSEAGEASASWDAICEPASTIEPCTSAEIGVVYPVALEGHCEIEVAYIDGRYWLTASGHPEPSGGMGVVPGAIVLHSREEALFEGDDGAEVTFVPAPPRYVPPPCA